MRRWLSAHRPSPLRRRRSTVAGVLVGGLAGVLVLAGAAPASADEGSIDHVQRKDGGIQVLYSLPDGTPAGADLGSVALTLDGTRLDATAELASDARSTLRRTTLLAIDVSNSMAGAKFAAAKQAARTFLDSAPDDVYVGIVTFAGRVSVLQAPSLDRAASRRLVDGLDLSLGTHLYAGLAQAARTSGAEGQRSVLLLSDGRDTSGTPMAGVTRLVRQRHVKVDVIALAQSAQDEGLLAPLSTAGGGQVISAADPEQLGRIFAAEAQTLASQVLVTAPLPAGAAQEGTLSLDIEVGGTHVTDSAFVTLGAPRPRASGATTTATRLSAPPAGLQVSRRTMLAGVAALGLGLLVLMVAILGGLGRRPDSLESRIAPYSSRGAGARKSAEQPQSLTAQAVGVAQKALEGSHGLEARLSAKLDAGGLGLKPAEWLLVHGGVAVVVTGLSLVLSGGNPLVTVVGLLVGVVLPWVYLGRKQAKRLKAFNSQLANTLQLLAGSLQAGLSIAQGVDTIVREGAEPVAGEFRRALVETRLGVQIEDALDAMAERMMSDDFRWTVMAIRIQREVGGNLAELLLNVAATLRERDYLRRQVKSLSAEGRFSAYILLALPFAVMLFESLTNAAYLRPLYTTAMGWVLLGAMAGLMGTGAFMMNRMVKMEV